MRNMVAMLGLLIVAVSTSALPIEFPGCDYQKCLDIVGVHGASCKTVHDALECADTEILNNPACPADVVAGAHKPIEQAKYYLETACRESEPDGCQYESCLQILGGQEPNCGTVPEAILCGEGRVLNNPACPADVRSGARDKIRQGQAFLREHCHFNISGGSAKCDVGKCLEGVNTQGFTCQTVADGVRCADRTILNNPDCQQSVIRVVEGHKEEAIYLLQQYCNRHSQEPASAVLSTNEDRGCHYEECLDIIERHGPDCGTVPEAILCGEGRVLNNPACPADVRNGARDNIRQGQAFLREHCPFNISGGSAKCDVGKCLEGVNTQGFTCQTVADGVQCADRTILNNPDCQQNLIRVVEGHKEEAIYLLQQYCNRHSQGQEEVEAEN